MAFAVANIVKDITAIAFAVLMNIDDNFFPWFFFKLHLPLFKRFTTARCSTVYAPARA